MKVIVYNNINILYFGFILNLWTDLVGLFIGLTLYAHRYFTSVITCKYCKKSCNIEIKIKTFFDFMFL